MSHWSVIKTEMDSLESLESAVKELGNARLLKDVKVALGYGSNKTNCDAVIRGGLHYDVAVIIDKETGSISLKTDFYNYKSGGVKGESDTVPVGEVLGKEFSKLKAYYAAHKSYAEAKRRRVKSSMHRINHGVHEMRGSNGKWQKANSSLWAKIKNKLPFREVKQENTSRLWVQCEMG